MIVLFFKVMLFFLDLWREKDKVKAEKKADIAEEIVYAFKETDKTKRAALLNVAVDRIHRLR